MHKAEESTEMQSEIGASKPKAARVRRQGIAFILLAVMLLVIVGMVGLAIDSGVAYFLKARLSQAADAAALAGARSLARGADIASQTASAQAVATNFFNANFPNGFWGSTTSLSTPSVTENDTTKIRYVTITATATVPLYFMRALGKSTVLIGTTAQAARRDANIMLVLDRSGSMATAESSLVAYSTWFVNQFAQGRDNVGLVTFGGTYTLVQPTTSFSPAVPNMIATLNSTNVAGTTNHSQPLWVAYQALAALNEPGALNAIVFFTDGEPNTITADFGPYRSSTCDTTGAPMIGLALGETTTGFFGTSLTPPYQPQTLAAGTTPSAYVSTAYDLNDSCPASGDYSYCKGSELISQYSSKYSGCKFITNGSGFFSDITQIPPTDYYGNQTAPSTNAYCGSTGSSCSTVTLKGSGWNSGTNLTGASFNAGDQAAQRMRAGALNSIVPLIDTIGLNDGYAIDSVYMNRLANTVNSTIYNSSYPTGIYVYATSTSDLQSAFVQIASQILHLSQ
jgi:Flp pilus assembly protein TadG